MSRTKFYPFWNAPAAIWAVRLVFGSLGVLLLLLFLITLWDGTTKDAFTVYKLWPSGRPFYIIFRYSSDPHSVYWGALVGYCTICFVIGSFFSLIAYAATFRAVIPGSWKKKNPA